MEPMDFKKALDAVTKTLIAAGIDVQSSAAQIGTTVVDCCGKAVDECQCTSTSSKEDENIFTGSTYTLEEFAVTKRVMQLVSTRNVLSLLFTDVSYENVDFEFKRFLAFIGKHPEPGRSQLATLILPVIVHLYALLLQGENIGALGARAFLNSYAGVFRQEEGYKEILDALSKFHDIEKLKQDLRFQHYMERKTVIKISKDAFKSLQNFLRFSKTLLGESILLSVLSFNIEFEDSDLCNCPNEDKINEDGETSGESKKNEAKIGEKNEIDAEAERELKHKDPELENIGITKIVLYTKQADLCSIDFNCAKTEIAYATGDCFIYTLAIATPDKKKKKEFKFFNGTTVVLQTFKHNASSLKSTRDPQDGNVYVVKYLPGEPFSLLAACNPKVRLFNTKTCSFLAEFITDGSFIYDIDIDSTGQYFATANQHLSSYIYTFSQNVRVCTLTGHEKPVTCVKFHPNGIYVATGSEDCTVRLFEVESGQCVRLFVGHLFGVWKMDFSYDGNLIASADASGLVNVWDIKDSAVISKMPMRVREEMHNVISSLCFHEKKFILAACNETGVQFWDARNPEHRHIIRSFKKPVIIQRHKGKEWNIVYLSYTPIEPPKEFRRPKKY